MMDKMSNRVTEGVRTPEGRIVVILLIVSIALVIGGIMSINVFAGDTAGESGSAESAESESSLGAEVVQQNPVVEVTSSEAAKVAENIEQIGSEPSDGSDGGAVEPGEATTEITYVGNGGTSDGKDVVHVGDLPSPTYITLTDQGFVREGYTMVGWSLAGDQEALFGLGDLIAVDDVGKGEPGYNTLYAVWERNE